MNKKYVLGIDIGGTNIRMGIVGEDYKVMNFERDSSKKVLGLDAVSNLSRAISEYLYRAGMREMICAVAIGVPGQVGRDNSYVYSVPKIKGFQNTDLGKQLSEDFQVPVYVSRDVNFLLLHDIRTMNLDPEHNRTILAFYIGTGFGNALYLNGRIHTGRHGVAGELGHIPLYGVTEVCNCGAIGCVETRCCGHKLVELAEKEFPECPVEKIFSEHGSDPKILRFVKDCALPIATEVTLLDPDLILLGGGVLTIQDFPMDLLEQEVRARSRHPLPSGDIQFVYASDSQANGVIGGGIAALEWLKETN